MIDEIGKSLSLPRRAQRAQRKRFELQSVISACSVVDFQFLRGHLDTRKKNNAPVRGLRCLADISTLTEKRIFRPFSHSVFSLRSLPGARGLVYVLSWLFPFFRNNGAWRGCAAPLPQKASFKKYSNFNMLNPLLSSPLFLPGMEFANCFGSLCSAMGERLPLPGITGTLVLHAMALEFGRHTDLRIRRIEGKK